MPQPPAKKPGLAILIGIGKPKGPMPPPPSGPKAADEDSRESTGQKASPDEAGVFETAQNCSACDNWEPDTQSCKVVEGKFTGEARGCIQYFEPKGTEAQERQAPIPGAGGLGSPNAGEQDASAV